MQGEEFDLQKYLTRAVENIVAESIRATLNNPKESAFMLKFAASAKRASKLRAENKKKGEHIPPFLIASITRNCNLRCSGCFSYANNECSEGNRKPQLSAQDWEKIFLEAASLGMSFIFLAGGEPMLRRDVIEAAAKVNDILFPILTNGIFMDEKYLSLFDRNRNLLPVMSIEGGMETTDNRRGRGVYEKLMANMNELKKRNLIFGTSITLTTQNLDEVTHTDFIDNMYDKGCKLIIYVEYVPVSEDSACLAPGDNERRIMDERLKELRAKYSDAVFLSFPGDEKNYGGCIAAGRGFFHINAEGGAEPCPFSPFSDVNVAETSLSQAIHSKLFSSLKDNNLLMDEHTGGCALYEKRSIVESLLVSK